MVTEYKGLAGGAVMGPGSWVSSSWEEAQLASTHIALLSTLHCTGPGAGLCVPRVPSEGAGKQTGEGIVARMENQQMRL